MVISALLSNCHLHHRLTTATYHSRRHKLLVGELVTAVDVLLDDDGRVERLWIVAQLGKVPVDGLEEGVTQIKCQLKDNELVRVVGGHLHATAVDVVGGHLVAAADAIHQTSSEVGVKLEAGKGEPVRDGVHCRAAVDKPLLKRCVLRL